MSAFTICGTLMHAPACGEVEILEDALVEVDGEGTITAVYSMESSSYGVARNRAKKLIELSEGQYLLPGMIDCHVHAPQFPQLGKALNLPLHEWLQRSTFPLEAKYEDLEFAKQVYSKLVDTLLANGTTTAMYYATRHLGSTRLLADICLERGQRAYVGRVAMDNPDLCPDYYRDPSHEQGIEETRALIEYVRGLRGNKRQLVSPVVTPRFIPSCTDELLGGLGEVAAEYHCYVQTHCSESDWEHQYVIDRHGVTDTQSLAKFGLLGGKTVLAHSNFIDDEDMILIKQFGSGIAHCPLSNFYFSNAVFPARKALDRGLKVGLGTDISGGPSPSLLHNCHAAVTASRALEEGVDPEKSADQRGSARSRIDFKEAFWMATTGGALCLSAKIGQFTKGYRFDAMVVDTNIEDSNLRIWREADSHEDILQKIVYNASRHNITKVWVQGRSVK